MGLFFLSSLYILKPIYIVISLIMFILSAKYYKNNDI